MTPKSRRALSLALLCPLSAVGQVFPEVTPHISMWDNNHGRGDLSDPCLICRSLTNNGGPVAPPTGWVGDDAIHGMIIQTVDNGKYDFAPEKVARQVVCRMQRYSQQFQQGRVHLVLKGFAHCPEQPAAGDVQPTCLLHPDDAIPYTPSEFGAGNEALTVGIRARNPWMTHASEHMKLWIKAFAQEYRRIALTGVLDPSLPAEGCNQLSAIANLTIGEVTMGIYAFPIDRLLIDSETYPDVKDDRVLKAMASGAGDPAHRWNTEPVPGFGGQTLAQLWTAAAGQWDTTDPAFSWDASIADVLDRTNFPFFRASKRRVYLWYNAIAYRAKQHILESQVFAPAREILADLGTTPLTGNYGEFAADGQPDEFGWQRVRGPDANRNEDPVGGTIPPPPMVSSKTLPRISLQSFNESSRMIGYDALGSWYNFKTQPRGPFTVDQPQLYSVDTSDASYNHRVRMKNLYLPANPDEAVEDVFRRVHRHRLETPINSYAGTGQSRVEPYFPAPDAQLGTGVMSHLFTAAFVRDQFAAARAKQHRQINVFHGVGNSQSTPSTTLWNRTLSLMQQVHAFRIQNWEWTIGDNPGHSVHPLGDITNTLRDPAQLHGPETVLIATSTLDAMPDWAMTEAVAQFETWLPAPGESLQLVYEGRIHIPGMTNIANPAAFPAHVEISLWDWYDTTHAGGWWHPVVFNDDPFEPHRCLFGTPDLSARRGALFGDGSRFVSSSGHVRVRIAHFVHASVIDTTPFQSRHNLLQVFRHDTFALPPEGLAAGTGEIGEHSAPLGPDLNTDRAVSAADLDYFFTAFAADSLAADYDGDGEVTSADVAAFAADYAAAE